MSTNYGKFSILRENTLNVRNFQKLSNENKKTVKYGIETIPKRTPFSNEYELVTSLHDFKWKIENWHCYKCLFV